MQSVSTEFNNLAQGDMRPLSWRVLMAFEKDYLPDVEFFTIGVSTIGSGDLIKGDGDVIQEWDKFLYEDFSDRVMSIEVTRQEEAVNSVALAMADMELENTDDYFTPNGGSAIQNDILPYRPAKLYGGFGDINVPLFTGLTDKMPVIDDKKGTAKFHLIDFMYSLFNRPIDQALVLTNVQTDQALEALMDLAGILPTQYDFDVGYNVINFVYFAKDTKFGDAVKELMEAEMGRFYMDEAGVICFRNRQSYSDTPVYTFDESSVLAVKTVKQDDLINVVEIKAKVREVQAKQKYWELQSAALIPAGGFLDIWADFDDPVTSVDLPSFVSLATTSSYTTSTAENIDDGTIVTSGIGVSITPFAQSALMTFTNSNAYPVYVNVLELWATPAKVVKEIYVREQDDISVGKYDERILPIENNFISTEIDAYSKAKMILNQYATYGKANELTVKGNPALQIGDTIAATVSGMSGNYFITKIVERWMGANFTQILTVKHREIVEYFTIGISTIGSTDQIAP